MDSKKYMFLINGQDKTDSVASFRFQDGMCEVIYSSAPKPYHYRAEKVQLLKVQSRIDPSQFIITVDGNPFSQIDEILDFGSFYRFIRTGKRVLTYPKGQVELQKNCLTSQRQAGVFEYFKETAAAVSLVAEDGLNILNAQYERIQSVSDATVLSCYLDSSKEPAVRALPEAVIYPFGLNQSQKTAVENALSSQISIIQGPPGTGKTQTILNIIANTVRNGQTVAVVSNNNSATLNVAEKLEKKGLSFLAAFLGSRANKEHFLEAQTGQYPDMSAWALEAEEEAQLNQEITVLSKELSEMLNAKNRIAAIEQELRQLTPEQHYFGEYYSTYAKGLRDEVKGLSSQEILSLWLEYEQHAQQESMWASLLQKIAILFRFNRSALRVFFKAPELVIPYLQRQFYMVRQQELTEERVQLEKKLERYAFDEKMAELTEKSLRLFRAELSEKFPWEEPRRCFEMRDFRGKSREFNREYPVILSTTYSIKGTLNFEHTYFYAQKGDFSEVILSFNQDKMQFAASLPEGLSPSTVSEEEARLAQILLYPGLKEYFIHHGWATEFGTGPYIMSPVLFQNIYKGALGEVAGKFILEKELGVPLQEIEDPAKFESFDFVADGDVFFDFKHWKWNMQVEERPMREKVLEKLDAVGGKRAFIVNLAALIRAKRFLYSLRDALNTRLSDHFFARCWRRSPVARQVCCPSVTGRSRYSVLTRPVCGK